MGAARPGGSWDGCDGELWWEGDRAKELWDGEERASCEGWEGEARGGWNDGGGGGGGWGCTGPVTGYPG